MTLRRWLGRIERLARGEIFSIPQRDGSTYYYHMQDMADCYIRNLEQTYAKMDGEEPPPIHPLQRAMLGAVHWRPSYETYTDGLGDIPEVPDLSED